uniref:Uncharacterized protein n=1 Tax=Tetraselmis sp. GSL018 TaxID=582737 RepID=A0A061SN02_9CHLO
MLSRSVACQVSPETTESQTNTEGSSSGNSTDVACQTAHFEAWEKPCSSSSQCDASAGLESKSVACQVGTRRRKSTSAACQTDNSSFIESSTPLQSWLKLQAKAAALPPSRVVSDSATSSTY